MRDDINDVAIDAARNTGSTIAGYASAFAVAFSGYSLFEGSVRQPDLKIFVPPVVQYAQPYQNSNFEVFAVPVTLVNTGARTGTILGIDLVVSDGKGATKTFYSADFGNWTLERARAFGFKPFSPISIPGKTSFNDVVLFYPRREEKVQAVVKEIGTYRLSLTLKTAEVDDFWLLDRWLSRKPDPVTVDMTLPVMDHRAFNVGTLPMHQKDYQVTVSGK